jgi:polysaccharide biosynthesis protein PelF
MAIPSMVDLGEFDPHDRPGVREELDVPEGAPLLGWVGRLDRKKRGEDFLRAAALVRGAHRQARFVVIGGPDAFMPEYASELRALAGDLGLDDALRFLGDRPDVPRLLAGLDALAWLSRGEGLPHVIAEAGAARLPVVATRDHGSVEMIEDGVSGLYVPHESPAVLAAALDRLLADPGLRRRLGSALRRTVEREYCAAVVARRWEMLFDEVIAERERRLA